MYREIRTVESTLKPRITVGIPTKNRYDSLSHTLLSIAMQTLKPVEVLIVDDSDSPIDIRSIPHYAYILKLFYEYKIDWKYHYGQKKGQHYSHQLIQDQAVGDFVFRIDDDEVAESDTLEKLSKLMEDGVGAVAPLVLMPLAEQLKHSIQYLPTNSDNNSIKNIYAPNIQWFRWFEKDDKVKSVDHLYSCFLYRKGIARFELSLSPVAHREETIFSHSIKRAGYKLLVDSTSVVWHFREEKGGIRSHQNQRFYEDDEKIFQGYLKAWNVNSDRKFVVLDNGLGDHYAFKNILPKLRSKYKNITLAVCFPDMFYDEPGLELISIADAKNIFGDIGHFGIYHKMTEWGWDKSLTEAFEKLYL